MSMNRATDFDSIKIMLASPERIREWSLGEVKKPETINYRTLRPEREGLFCEKIFGTMKDWECYCGKFKSIRYKGVICDRCGVEVTHSKVRRERMGHVELATPVAHIWYYRSVPSRIGLLLNMTVNELKSILYYEKYVILDPADSNREIGELIDDDEYYEFLDLYGNKFVAMMGGEAIKEMLSAIDMDAEIHAIRDKIADGVKASDKRILKRLEILEALRESGNRPEWMMLDVVPVIPPELRPMVQLDGGRFATSDLNDLYRRVINRNNRLRRLQQLRAPDIIVRNEKRMLQEAVDALFDNSRRAKSVKGKGNRPLKSLSDMLKGKTGRFRQNLLGKRVDYSGRSVIVIGPELKLHQMGLPKKMALELFKPFIMKRLVDLDLAPNIKTAKKRIEAEEKEVFEALDEVIKEHPVMLNRAPTLHRLGIQAFLPVLVEGKAIKLHPLVCRAFNADFDGDQMAIHVPLSPKAQIEAWMLMLAPHNLLNPANGNPIVSPTQDMVLGLYLLTSHLDGDVGEGKVFSGLDEIYYALDAKAVGLRAKISVLFEGRLLQTTPGRIIFNATLPVGYVFVNRAVSDKEANRIVADAYSKYGPAITTEILDRFKELGFRYSTLFAPSIALSDIKTSSKKKDLITKANAEVEEVTRAHHNGVITNEERYKKVIEIWTKTNDAVTESMFAELEKDQSGFNPVYTMAASGARGSRAQIRQLAGMRGLMARPSGEIIELAIRSNFREGLGVLEFFISTSGARKGLADTALKTADAGYLTRRLVDISQDVIITEQDCGTKEGVWMGAVREGEKTVVTLGDRSFGRVLAADLVDPISGEVVIAANTMVNKEASKKIDNLGIDKVFIRSALTCETRHGLCASCYGMDLARLKPVELGEAVGTIAAQSIGEPGTQLTMRTFHVGGVATNLQVKNNTIKVPVDALVTAISGNIIVRENGERVFVTRGNVEFQHIYQMINESDLKGIRVEDGQHVAPGEILANSFINSEGQETNNLVAEAQGYVVINNGRFYIKAETQNIPVKIGASIQIEADRFVQANTVIGTFDPYNDVVLSDVAGTVVFEDIEKDKNFKKDEEGNFRILEYRREKLNPRIRIGNSEYTVPLNAIVSVKNGQEVKATDILFKLVAAAEKTRDITGGLPRVEELFEGRRPKDASTLAEVDGVIEDRNEVVKEKRVLYIVPENEEQEKVKVTIPTSKRIMVRNGDFVRAGDQIDEGSLDPHDILRVLGVDMLHQFLIQEVQEVYRLQGVFINDKHIEIIVRQMLRKVEVADPGDTNFVLRQQVDQHTFRDENNRVVAEGGVPATSQQILLGITKASLNTDSFVSAASFQETTRVLTDAAIKGKQDGLLGLKENVIIGHLIPAGSGLKNYNNIEIFYKEYGDIQTLYRERKEEERRLLAMESERSV